jgi:hypothetical protein
MDQFYYNMEGEPISRREGLKLFGDDPNLRRVAFTRIEEGEHVGVEISTVLLVINHQFGEGPPIIFETMVFHDGDGWRGEEQRRYSTKEEALAGHREIVAKITSGA